MDIAVINRKLHEEIEDEEEERVIERNEAWGKLEHSYQ